MGKGLDEDIGHSGTKGLGENEVKEGGKQIDRGGYR